jgi:cytochrome c-type biogenesis protein CcmH
VTAFIVVCVAMVLAALLWMVLPLLRSPKTVEGDLSAFRKERRISGAAVALVVPVLAIVMYAGLSNWDWKAAQMEESQVANMEDAIKRLEAKLADNPKSLEGWLMLGRSYTAMGRYARAADAFQQAYDLSQGQDVEAIVGLGEALVLTDEASLTGRAGKLFETALVMAPNHPKALWYGSIASLRSGELSRARDRLQLLMAQNPPEELRGVLERQIQDLNQQIGEGGQAAQPTAPPVASADAQPATGGGARSIQVAVSIAPANTAG